MKQMTWTWPGRWDSHLFTLKASILHVPQVGEGPESLGSATSRPSVFSDGAAAPRLWTQSCPGTFSLKDEPFLHFLTWLGVLSRVMIPF